jgi:hypothetical protein
MSTASVYNIANNLHLCAEELQLAAIDSQACSLHVIENLIQSDNVLNYEPSYVAFSIIDDFIVIPSLRTFNANII